MKYWNSGKGGQLARPGNAYISMRDGDSDRILSIVSDGDKVVFTEACDGYFSVALSPAEAIEALQEAIEWIKEPK